MHTLHTTALALLLGTLTAGAAVAAPPAPLNASSDYAGQYVLEDGRILTVHDAGDTLTASIQSANSKRLARVDGARELVLTPEGPGRFSAKAAHLRLDFAQDARGDIAQVRVDDQAPPMMALARR